MQYRMTVPEWLWIVFSFTPYVSILGKERAVVFVAHTYAKTTRTVAAFRNSSE